jgi:hypothetical protein
MQAYCPKLLQNAVIPAMSGRYRTLQEEEQAVKKLGMSCSSFGIYP